VLANILIASKNISLLKIIISRKTGCSDLLIVNFLSDVVRLLAEIYFC